MRQLPKFYDPNLIVGFETSDDALVYQVRDDLAVVQTVDFFPPVVDDPYLYGQIAAANSLSDIYAMGGDPALAMNLICFPTCLPMEVMGEILQGGYSKVQEAGAIIAGGHTIDDPVPKYGLCVTGFMHPKAVLPNSSCREGDLLVLTKPLGIGILNTAMKAQLTDSATEKQVTDNMSTLNKYGKDAVAKVGGANACTDVTGFGLLGHALEMAQGSGKTIEIFSKDVPFLAAAEEFAKMGIVPAGAYENMHYIKNDVEISSTVPQFLSDILADPQTSGGLLVSLPEKQALHLVQELNGVTPCAQVVGQVVNPKEKAIIVR